MVDFYDQNSAVNCMCSVYLLVVQPITIGGKFSCWEEEDEERDGTMYVITQMTEEHLQKQPDHRLLMILPELGLGLGLGLG